MTIPVRDANNNIIYIATLGGTGTIGDPYVTRSDTALPTGAASNATLTTVATNTGNTNTTLTTAFTANGGVPTRGKMRVYRFNPTVTSGTAYAQYDSVGGLLTLTNAVESAGRGAFIQSVQVNATTGTGLNNLRIIFFDANPTASTFTNDAAIVLNFADQEKMVAVATIGTAFQIDVNTFTANPDASVPLSRPIMPLTGTTVYAAIQANAAITFNSAADLDLTITLYDE